MKKRILKIALLLLALPLALFIWRFFILQPDKIRFHHDLILVADKAEYRVGDSIQLNVIITATDDDGLIRLFDDNSNEQIHVRKAINGDISPNDFGTFESTPYKSNSRYLLNNRTSYRLASGEKIETELKGKIYLEQGDTIVLDFGKHGKYKSPFYEEYAIQVNIFELFPDLVFPVDLDYFVPCTNFEYIRLIKNGS